MQNDNEIKAIVQRSSAQLSDFYNGNSWVTENFKSKVLCINKEESLKKIEGHSHSVAQLVGHIIAWRNFVLQNYQVTMPMILMTIQKQTGLKPLTGLHCVPILH